MKVGILAGGFGTRLAEETEIRPKPMVEIGGMPILWHIMKHYHHYGYKEFAVALGYKGEYIKRWFKDYNDLDGSMTIHTGTGAIKRYSSSTPDWSVDLIENRPKDADGRPHQAPDGLDGNEHIYAHLGRWRRRRESRQAPRLPSIPRKNSPP